jgi:hypothetical protein
MDFLVQNRINWTLAIQSWGSWFEWRQDNHSIDLRYIR